MGATFKGIEMTDTVTRLMGLADEYAGSASRCEQPAEHTERKRQALQDELTRLFTPLSQSEVVDGFCKQPHDVQFVSVFNAGVRFAEKAHGIGGESLNCLNLSVTFSETL